MKTKIQNDHEERQANIKRINLQLQNDYKNTQNSQKIPKNYTNKEIKLMNIKRYKIIRKGI